MSGSKLTSSEQWGKIRHTRFAIINANGQWSLEYLYMGEVQML